MTRTKTVPKPIAKAINKLKVWPGKHRIAVGLSGGVDSSIAASLFVEAGWEVAGLTLWLLSGKGSCCSEGLVDAAGICEELQIQHHVVDSRETFQKEIVEKLVNGYKAGITPLPCSQCNRSVKFSQMVNWAKEKLQMDFIATGHYARVQHAGLYEYPASLQGESQARHKLLRGFDHNKDQSYFLYDLPQEVLGSVIFPLGELRKEDTREEALRKGLRTAKKAESQDLCLAEHHGSMKAFLDKYLPPREGKIVLEDGTIVGKHDGIEHFTIGQRKGLGVAWKEPLHVVRINAEKNEVQVATRSESGRKQCVVGAVNWISIYPPQESLNLEVQVRYRSSPKQATLTPIDPTESDLKSGRPYRCLLTFKDEQFSITPGQAAVFYSGEIVLGGGIIEKEQEI